MKNLVFCLLATFFLWNAPAQAIKRETFIARFEDSPFAEAVNKIVTNRWREINYKDLKNVDSAEENRFYKSGLSFAYEEKDSNLFQFLYFNILLSPEEVWNGEENSLNLDLIIEGLNGKFGKDAYVKFTLENPMWWSFAVEKSDPFDHFTTVKESRDVILEDTVSEKSRGNSTPLRELLYYFLTESRANQKTPETVPVRSRLPYLERWCSLSHENQELELANLAAEVSHALKKQRKKKLNLN